MENYKVKEVTSMPVVVAVDFALLEKLLEGIEVVEGIYLDEYTIIEKYLSQE